MCGRVVSLFKVFFGCHLGSMGFYGGVCSFFCTVVDRRTINDVEISSVFLSSVQICGLII